MANKLLRLLTCVVFFSVISNSLAIKFLPNPNKQYRRINRNFQKQITAVKASRAAAKARLAKEAAKRQGAKGLAEAKRQAVKAAADRKYAEYCAATEEYCEIRDEQHWTTESPAHEVCSESCRCRGGRIINMYGSYNPKDNQSYCSKSEGGKTIRVCCNKGWLTFYD